MRRANARVPRLPNAASLAALDNEIKLVKNGLRAAGLPSNLLKAIEIRALKTGRKLTGEFRTNREPRWTVARHHPQYGTETDCKLILLRLYATMLEFEGAPQADGSTIALLEHRLGRPLEPNSFRDELLLETMSYTALVYEVEHPRPGISSLHIGHRDPTKVPKHTPDNVEWRTERSNLIQGSLTLSEARMYLVRMIARYFDLGEVEITPSSSP